MTDQTRPSEPSPDAAPRASAPIELSVHRPTASSSAEAPAPRAGARVISVDAMGGDRGPGPVLAGMATGFAIGREWRGSIYASIVAHAVNNAVVLGLNVFVIG